MKAYMHVLFLTIGGASLLLMTGCRAISTTHTQDIGGPRFTPSDPAKIEILQMYRPAHMWRSAKYGVTRPTPV